jgi:hypothetical protein
VLVFVVSMKHFQIARNWDYAVQLLERTLRSICRQSSENYRVVVVANQDIEAVARNDAVDLLLVDYPPPEGGLADKRADKARKLKRGFEYASTLGATHVMAVDADDFVSRRLAEVVESSPQTGGWLLRTGYLWKEGSRIAYLNRRNFNHSCGSSAIAHIDLFHHLFDEEWRRYSFEEPRLPVGLAFKSFPFPGAVYCILHRENMFMGPQRLVAHRTAEGSIRYYVRKARKYTPVPVTRHLMNEFGLYSLGLRDSQTE